MNISAQKIEILMAKSNLSLTQLAELCGISRTSLATIRKRETCRIGTAVKLCTGLGCSVDDIVPDSKER